MYKAIFDPDGSIFAMKVMKKQKIFDMEINDQIANEIEIMIILDHKNIIKMPFYFETKDELILILEFANKGTLFHKIKEREKFLYHKKKGKKKIHLNDKMIIQVSLPRLVKAQAPSPASEPGLISVFPRSGERGDLHAQSRSSHFPQRH